MLSRIAIENFRSIKNRIEFSLEATSFKEHYNNLVEINSKKLLKSSVVYGPNASGKSNLLMAFTAIDFLVLRSANFTPNQEIGPYEPYLLDAASKNSSVKFELEFYIEDILYTLYLEYTSKEITREELIFRPKKQPSIIYSRINKAPISFGEYYKGERKSIEKKLLSNQLFLSKAVLDNVEILIPVFEFFQDKLSSFPFFEGFRENKYQQLYAERLADPNDIDFNRKFNRIICAFDTGIKKVQSELVDWNENPLPDEFPDSLAQKIKEDYKYKIKTIHDIYENDQVIGETNFDIRMESTGTQNLLVSAGIILDALEDGSILIVDEFEKNLHPHVTKSLIRLFHNPELNDKNAQLIFATHDMSQLDGDIFRRDQIWFVEKNEKGESDLFSMADISGVRSNVPYDKWYDSGKFGATPIINELEMTF
ncbi:AAA family ATPase [Fulvivirgaceae bacterium BMA12]|uniref:AAA family ATPase n=1 Tax=Agaribacillus aureus TaxID=3051825 RepID=A0ABT8L7F6_9BACT|nr:AAA family ATPase [Fulvivirgaceae bacterium BMA12]